MTTPETAAIDEIFSRRQASMVMTLVVPWTSSSKISPITTARVIAPGWIAPQLGSRTGSEPFGPLDVVSPHRRVPTGRNRDDGRGHFAGFWPRQQRIGTRRSQIGR